MTIPVIVSIAHLSKTFDTRQILNDITFEVNEGETVVILGRSGTGKSVTLKAIIGLIEPSSGEIKVYGKNIHAMDEHQRLAFRKKIGYVFQNAALFDSLNVFENVGFPLLQDKTQNQDDIRQLVEDRLKMVGLAHAIDQYPDELSGGMRKRVGLARALINLPQLILYDEPTSGLDPLTTDVINQIILRLRSQLKVTSIVVTHDMKSAFTIADRIIMLDQGRIVIEGTPTEIQNSDNPWVQHFIGGHALDTERIDTAVFPALARHDVQDSGTITHHNSHSQRKISARLEAIGSDSSSGRANTSGLLPAIRNRRKTTDTGNTVDNSMSSEPEKQAGIQYSQTIPLRAKTGNDSKIYPAAEWMPENSSRDSNNDSNNNTQEESIDLDDID